MKTAQDSYTITIKQIVRFQETMHLEKFQVDKMQNGRLLAQCTILRRVRVACRGFEGVGHADYSHQCGL